MELRLEQAAAAYGALAERRPEALIELLHPEVEWIEYLGQRQSRLLQGAEAVADFLRRRAGSGCSLHLTGLAKIGQGGLAVGFGEPWWLDRQGMGPRLAYYLLGDAHQYATVDGRISRIESHTTYFAPRRFDGHEEARADLTSLLRR